MAISFGQADLGQRDDPAAARHDLIALAQPVRRANESSRSRFREKHLTDSPEM
jgi:hypothetical protein